MNVAQLLLLGARWHFCRDIPLRAWDGGGHSSNLTSLSTSPHHQCATVRFMCTFFCCHTFLCNEANTSHCAFSGCWITPIESVSCIPVGLSLINCHWTVLHMLGFRLSGKRHATLLTMFCESVLAGRGVWIASACCAPLCPTARHRPVPQWGSATGVSRVSLCLSASHIDVLPGQQKNRPANQLTPIHPPQQQCCCCLPIQ